MITHYLAMVIGWFLVVMSLMLLVRHEHIRSVMQDIISRPGLFFVFAFIAFILGLLMVTTHNIWVMGWPVVVTLLAWLVLISGLARLFFPEATARMGESFYRYPQRMQIVGAVVLLIGLFLLYHVYQYQF